MAAKLRILHLEDDALDCELIRQRLEESGQKVEVTCVDSMAAFAEALRSRHYDAILSDYTVPGTDPRDALRLALASCPDVPFVFVSGTIGEDLAIETMKMGAADYVLKERLGRLVPTLQRALRESKEAAGRKEAERALRESERRLRLAMEIGAIGSFELDVASRGIHWDRQACRMLGISDNTISALDLVHPDDLETARRAVERALDPQSREAYAMELRFVRPDREVRWIAIRGRAVFDDVSDPPKALRLIGALQDITDRKRAEEYLKAAKTSAERAQEQAEEAGRAKDRFLAILSHELRTPLTAVLPALEALHNLVPPEGQSHLEMASRNVEMEARIIDDLLDITRISRGKIELRREKVELAAVLQRAADVCRADMRAKGQHFAMALESGPQFVDGDPARLQQVFWNLLQNSVKFTPQGGCIGVRTRQIDSRVIAEVHDSGQGIDPDAMARIFTAFEQETKSVTRQFGGLGLGLAICKVLVEMHGGAIRAYSEGRGKGAVFTVELPLADRESAQSREPEPGRVDEGEGRLPGKLRILLVEDHLDTARILAHMLTRAGHKVQHAADVATALKLAKQEPFDVMVSDLGLPDGSGHSLMQQLVREGHRLPAIALSGYGMPEDIQKSESAGFAEHVTKPINFATLQSALARLTVGSDGLANQ